MTTCPCTSSLLTSAATWADATADFLTHLGPLVVSCMLLMAAACNPRAAAGAAAALAVAVNLPPRLLA